MSDPTEAIIAAVRAEERANAAHERLDRMNGSIDRLANHVAAASGKLDIIAALQSQKQDERTGRYYSLQNVNVFVAVVALIVAVVSVSIAAGWFS